MKKIFLAAPSYEHHEIEMALACANGAARDEDLDGGRFALRFHYRKGASLLALGFNEAWLQCLNDTEPWDYWAMVHGDIEPANGWLSTMLDEMEAGDFDVLHAVAPIKDGRAITSTGIGPLWQEPSLTRKLTIAELSKLPGTFTLQDCVERLEWPPGHAFEKLMVDWRKNLCLLPNTGCLLVRLGPVVRRFPGWSITDRLSTVDKDGKHRFADAEGLLPEWSPIAGDKLMAHNAPEDWKFGRWCAQHGLKVGGTWKVEVGHWGKARWSNRRTGEELTDSHYLACRQTSVDGSSLAVDPQPANVGR